MSFAQDFDHTKTEYLEFFQEYFDNTSNPKLFNSNTSLNKFNYTMYLFNMSLDNVVFIPGAFVYEISLHSSLKERLNDFLENINTPYYFVNNVLQGKLESSLSSFWRFVINSTLGLFGVFDVASLLDIKPQTATLGNTMEFYNFPRGNYVVLPLVGGVYARDIFSVLGHVFLNPLKFITGGHLIFNFLDLFALKHKQLFQLYYIYNDSLNPFYQYQRSIILGKVENKN